MIFEKALTEACNTGKTARKETFIKNHGQAAYDKIKEVKKAILKDPKARANIKGKDKESGAYAIATKQVLK